MGLSSVSRSKDRDLVFSPVTSEKSTLFSWVTEIVRLSGSGLPAGRQAGTLNLSSYLCIVYSLYKTTFPFNNKKFTHTYCNVNRKIIRNHTKTYEMVCIRLKGVTGGEKRVCKALSANCGCRAMSWIYAHIIS